MDNLNLYIDKLKNNKIEEISCLIDPKLFNLPNEKDLKFPSPIKITGKAYLSSESLILNLNINFEVSMPCSICNSFTNKTINIKNYYITKELKKVHSYYNYLEEIRNISALEIPSFVECLDNCKKREDLKNYLKKENENINKHFPFSNL
jgi:hypothetical protein